jgi:hypothetical protein
MACAAVLAGAGCDDDEKKTTSAANTTDTSPTTTAATTPSEIELPPRPTNVPGKVTKLPRPEIHEDPNKVSRPVAVGTYEFHGSGVNLEQEFVGYFDAKNCAQYSETGVGAHGDRFETPTILYPTGAGGKTLLAPKVYFAGNGGKISPFGGPGTYTNKGGDVGGDVGVRIPGGSPGGTLRYVSLSDSQQSRASFDVRPYGAGSGALYFSGVEFYTTSASKEDVIVTGKLYWSCVDRRLDRDQYTLNP